MKRLILHALLGSYLAAASVTGQTPTEVVVLGGVHWSHLWNPDYSPTHLRALLSKIDPDAVGIENFPEWQVAGVQFHPGLPEPEIAMSWADEHDVPVYGVKVGDDLTGWERSVHAFRQRLAEQSEEMRRAALLRGFRSSASFQAGQAFGSGRGIDWVHSAEGIQAQLDSRQRYSESQRAWLAEGDEALTERVLETVRTHQPRRMAVILGSDHLGPLVELLRRAEEVNVIGAETFLPLTPAEVDAAWRPKDAEMVLGASLDAPLARAAPQSRNLDRAKHELERLSRAEGSSAAARYYRACWHMLQFEYDEADNLLSQVLENASGADDQFRALPGVHWLPLRTYTDLATFALAVLHDLQGDHEGAVPHYRQLIEAVADRAMPRVDVVWYFDLEAYLGSLVESPYSNHSDEAIRALEFRRALLWSETPEEIRQLALGAPDS